MPDHLPSPASAEMAGAEETCSLEEQLRRLIRRWSEQRLKEGGHEGTLHQDLLALVEKPLFDAVLELHGGQFATAARVLGIHRTTLKKKVDEP